MALAQDPSRHETLGIYTVVLSMFVYLLNAKPKLKCYYIDIQYVISFFQLNDSPL